MKSPIFLLVFAFLLKYPPSTNGQSLQDDLNDLQQHVPMAQIQELFVRYLMADPEFRQTVQYFRGPEFANMWNRFLEVPKVRELFTYMASAGLMVNEALEMFAGFTGMEKPRTKFRRSIAPKSGGFRAFIAEVVELCSSSDLTSAHEAKKASSSQYREMVSKFEAPEFKRLLAEASDDPQVKPLQDELSSYGIDFDVLFELWKSFFGWSSIF
ncbi:hypothetical protein pipiens_005312 [Culex pipiens pipiens]|uniref:Uncharacterized protein n=1 Tax=Culex pipiens pipiens TaxID=38569 RepID=A0ABD1DXR6_CULPP